MALLNYFFLCLVLVSVVKGDSNPFDVNDVLRAKLEKKLTDTKASENEVTDQKQLTQLVPRSNNNAVSQIFDHPVALLHSDDPPCPNFSDVIAAAKTAIEDLTKLVNNFMKVFTDTFPDPNNKCHLSLNPLKFLKCFLGAFANGYKEISSFIEGASSLREDFSNLWTQYYKYNSKCNSNWSFTDTLKLLDLLKYANDQIKDE